jgi:hypothetical protein
MWRVVLHNERKSMFDENVIKAILDLFILMHLFSRAARYYRHKVSFISFTYARLRDLGTTLLSFRFMF